MSERPKPRSLGDLFVSFTLLALQGFGGMLAVIRQELVERKRWLSDEEFVEDCAVAQVLPGPIGVNIAMMVGGRHFGLPGALVAMAGTLAIPLVFLLLLVLVYAQYADHPLVIGALRGMGAVTAGLIIATGLKLLGALKNNPLGMTLCTLFGLASFVSVVVLRWPLAIVLLGLGTLACLLAYWKLKP